MWRVCALWVFSLSTAYGQNTTDTLLNIPLLVEESQTDVDSAWTLQSAYLCGFTMLESGMVRAKNVKNIILKNIAGVSIGVTAFWILGYGFAFGDTDGLENGFIGTGKFMLFDFTTYDYWMFQWAFCATASTIASGAMAERTQFTSYMLYTFVVSVWIFPVSAHWVWSDQGWLRKLRMVDFAGSTVVHTLGGAVGLWGATITGPRIGRFSSDPKQKPQEIQGHNAVLVALGTLILWYCWYGFNSGSTKGLSGAKHLVASRAAATTSICAASASLVALIWNRIETKQYNANMLLNGALGGLAASTAGCAVIEPWSAFIIGVGAGVAFTATSKTLIRFKIDDPLDAVPVHLGCGLWGAISVCLFAEKSYLAQLWEISLEEVDSYGLLLGGGWGMVWVQLVGALCIAAWASVWSLLMFAILYKFQLLRVDQDTELSGIDNSSHGGPAYPNFQLNSF